jgi:hypothetical protein
MTPLNFRTPSYPRTAVVAALALGAFGIGTFLIGAAAGRSVSPASQPPTSQSPREGSQSTGDAQTVAISGVTVVPMTGAGVVLAGQTVVFRDRRIAAIGPASRVAVPASAVRVDGTGKFLIPGLIDSHVHLQYDEDDNRALLRAFTANGITTIWNLAGNPGHLRLRDAVARGEVVGPAIMTSGQPLGDPVGGATTTTPDEIAAAVAAQRRAGYDFVKMSGDLSRETYARLISAARQERIPLIGHAPRNLGVTPMIAERQPAVAHVEEYIYAWFFYRRRQQHPIPDLDAKIKTLADETAKAGTSVITTLSVYRGIADQIEDLDRVLARPEVPCLPRTVGDRWMWWPPNNTYVRRFRKDSVPLFRANADLLTRVTGAFARAHVRLLAGTDTPTATVVPGFSLHDELRELARAGLTPYQVLRSATADPAAFAGAGASDRGTLEIGRRADAVLLDANPLENIAHTSRIAGVMSAGRWLPSRDLAKMLRELAPGCGPLPSQ